MSVTPFSTPERRRLRQRTLRGELGEVRERRPGGVVVARVERAAQAVGLAGERRRLLDRAAEDGVDVARRGPVHARDLHEAAERDHPDPVLDPVPGALDRRRWEADVELPRAHPQRNRGDEVAELVHEDEQPEPDDRDEDRHAATSPRSAARRASASAATRSSRSRAGAPSTCSSAAATVSAISGNRIRPSRNAATATSLAALYAHGKVPPRSPALRARAAAGTTPHPAPRSGGRARRRGRAAPRRRPDAAGYVSANEIGTRMSGRPRWASSAPSRKRTSECTTERRMHDHLDPVVRDAEEPVRLDQLEALVGERRGVHSDLSSHRPGRMCERVGDRDVFELLARAAAERAARSSQHERLDRLRSRGPRDTGRSPSARCRRAAEGLRRGDVPRPPARRRRRGSPCLRARA